MSGEQPRADAPRLERSQPEQAAAPGQAPEGAPGPPPQGEWLADAKAYNRHLQLIVIGSSLLALWPFAMMGLRARSWPFWLLSLAFFGSPLLMLVWSLSRAVVIFWGADKRLRQLGYMAGQAHGVLRMIEHGETTEVRFRCPPPRDEIAVTPVWPRHGSERAKLGRALYEIGHPGRHPWKPKQAPGEPRTPPKD